VNSPFFVTGANKVTPRKPPELGQHNEQILREAGYDAAAITQLRESKAIG
jgi:formyl-CoA transferase